MPPSPPSVSPRALSAPFWGARWLALVALVGSLCTVNAHAAPYSGRGQAAIGEGGDRIAPRRQALQRARKAALEAALAELEGVDSGDRSRLLASSAAWTSAYRILQQSDDGATATVEVEVEIDLPRIEKLLRGAGEPVGGVMAPRFGELRGDGCGDEVVAGVREQLLARGLVSVAAEAPTVMNLRLRCERLGEVYQARAHGSRVTIEAEISGAVPFKSVALAFAEEPSAAEFEALRRALGGLSEALYRGRDTSILLEIAAPWPAARVRRLQHAIGSSVVGVRSVSVGGITSGGAVILRIEGGEGLVAEQLAQRVRTLQIPGVPLRILRVKGPRRIAATFD